MSDVTQKTEVGSLNGIPEKRVFWSIMSDYDLRTGLCELIDNVLDIWVQAKPRSPLKVQLALDAERQLISIRDNAGGVKREDLRLLITPGGSKNDPNAEIIGYFGVGSKRAVVALAEHVVIKTRAKDENESYQIDLTKDWLELETWELPEYQIPNMEAGSTVIELSMLKQTFNEKDIKPLLQHFGETYQWFLEIDGCHISVNDEEVEALGFDNWAYPPGQSPRAAIFEPTLPGHGKIGVDITAGLILDRDPEGDNYGVYLYCNNRLIVKELKTRDVGYFISGEAGVPHPDASLCRVIVKINGKVKLMPWNSSKTAINFSHPSFLALRPTLIQLVSHFSGLSRRTKDDWSGKIFRHTTGEIESIDPIDAALGRRLILPPLPRVNKPHVEQLKSRNKKQINQQPWTLGLVEAIAAVNVIQRQRLETKNRIALILLDSNFEIALKEFIVHRSDLFPNPDLKHLFERRQRVIDAVVQNINLPTTQ
ncbi:MAG: ATP-binding protein, partial [Chthoniobacterales bacterium]